MAGVEGSTINARALLPADQSYYTYTGSLTTPPCSESVRWFVMNKPMPVSNSAVQMFHTIIGRFPGQNGFQNNNRPIAPPNNRTVLVSR